MGRKKNFSQPVSILSILNNLNIDKKKIAIELNLEIVPKSSYENTIIKNGDSLEIIEFIGGG